MELPLKPKVVKVFFNLITLFRHKFTQKMWFLIINESQGGSFRACDGGKNPITISIFTYFHRQEGAHGEGDIFN